MESALIILVPEAEPVVGEFRRKYDPSAVNGMPAHITINYPFLNFADGDEKTEERLYKALTGHLPFDFVLAETRLFTEALYLAPEPEGPFIEIIKSIWREFPEAPPFGGIYPEIVPHLTIATKEKAGSLERVREEFLNAARGKLPIKARAERVELHDNREGVWKKRREFGMG